MFFECSQNSQENICARISFLIKLSFWHRSFPVNFANILRTTFLQQHLRMTASVFRTMQKKANVISFHKTCGWSVSWFWIYGKVLEQLIFNIIFELLKENELPELLCLHQSGFIPVDTCLLELISITQEMLERITQRCSVKKCS